jgi:hypothetical protein
VVDTIGSSETNFEPMGARAKAIRRNVDRTSPENLTTEAEHFDKATLDLNDQLISIMTRGETRNPDWRDGDTEALGGSEN